MAENRTFQFYGLGYGSSNVSITASVNSTQLYSGPVTTVDQPISPAPTPSESDQAILFEIPNSTTLNTDFAGSLPITIEVTGGSALMLGVIFSNYYQGGANTAGTSTNFDFNYTGTPTNSEGTPDPRSSVYVNGVQQVPPSTPSLGCWNWFLYPGDVLTCNWNISIGQVGNVVGNTTAYAGPYTATP
jgi:hypothetical protein